MNMRILLSLISIMAVSFMVSGEMTNNTSYIYNDDSHTQDVYKVFVDGYHGFYRVYDMNTGKELIGGEYEDKTLNIRASDTVIWENEDPAESFTVTSTPKLWPDKVGYLAPAKRFSYTFSQTGMYDIYIRQGQTLPHQAVIVSSLGSNKTTIDMASINKTVTYKEKSGESANKTKSKVTIKIYRKPKNVSGFETIVTIPIIIIISTILMPKKRR